MDSGIINELATGHDRSFHSPWTFVDAKTFTPFIKKTGKRRTNRTCASKLSLKPPKFYIAGQGHYMIFNNVIQPFYT